jgi:hypothetical protein
MAEISKVLQIGDAQRPESLQKNLHKIDSPYDLTSDIVTKSLNALQSLTGYDYRTNPTLDVIERLVDVAAGSNIITIGASRLAVEFGRRALTRNLDALIPTPKDLTPNFKKFFKDTEYKKTDAYITDPIKNPTKSVATNLLEKTIGYIDNDSYITSIYKSIALYKKLGDNVTTSDINYFHSGDMIKEKILQLNQNSVFSNYNVKNTSKIEFDEQSLVFRNTYSEDFVNQSPDDNKGLYFFDKSPFSETYTKAYFKNYPIQDGELVKDYLSERFDLEDGQNQAFGILSNDILKTREFKAIEPIAIKTVNSLSPTTDGFINRDTSVKDSQTFHYDSNTSYIEQLNTNFGVRRGLVYYTTKIAQDKNSIIPQNIKQLYRSEQGNDNTIYWKGNGACRTFTVFDQYDNFNRVIKFDGNGEKNSVLRDSVLPKIAPMIGDKENEKNRYFFTMENLAVKVTNNLDCDKGPNGGRWMWFVPYNVKISDNNQVNWSDINFLGRPEPIYSYQNTKRNLSLSFSLLIDTVSDIQQVQPTIQNYYNYLYACGEFALKEDDNGQNNIIPTPPPKKKRKPEPVLFDTDLIYYFKNDRFGVKTTNIDYTIDDDCEDLNEDGSGTIPEPTLSSLTFNNNFYNTYTAATQFLVDNVPNSTKIEINIQGYASKLFTKKRITSSAQYNSDLGFRRAYDMFKLIADYFYLSYTDRGFIENQSIGKTITEKLNLNGCEIIFNLKSKGNRGASGGSTFENRNDEDEIKDRKVVLSSIKAYLKPETDTNATNNNQTTSQNTTQTNTTNTQGKPCDPDLTLDFEKLKKQNKFPTGFEKLQTFVPSFNSQTPFDFTKRYVFLHQLTRPASIKQGTNPVSNIVFGRMPVFVLRYGDFLHTKAIANSINFDISEATWDLNPEGMGVIPLMCNVTMDLTLIGGQSLAGPLDKIQTANDSGFIANTSFNSGKYKNNNRFKSVRGQEFLQYKDKASGQDTTQKETFEEIDYNPILDPFEVTKPVDLRVPPTPFVSQLGKAAEKWQKENRGVLATVPTGDLDIFSPNYNPERFEEEFSRMVSYNLDNNLSVTETARRAEIDYDFQQAQERLEAELNSQTIKDLEYQAAVNLDTAEEARKKLLEDQNEILSTARKFNIYVPRLNR